jgi:hypothetical protein
MSCRDERVDEKFSFGDAGAARGADKDLAALCLKRNVEAD